MSTAISVAGLNKSFNSRKVLESISFRIEEGEFVALIGPSGSGKSTLLRHIAGFVPADGKTESCITVGNRIVQQRGRIMPDVRKIRSGIGFIFQQFNLAGRLPLIVNVLTGMLSRVPAHRSLLRWFTRSEVEEGLGALRQVGMVDHAWQRTSTLSGGQQQRAAIARSLVQNARVILADEPIASLDPESARNVMDILARINRDCGHTVLVSLHQVDVAVRYCSRVIALQMGKIVYDGPSQVLAPELSRKLYESADSGQNEVGSAPGVPAHMPQLDPKAAEALG